jgi:hypothetical protein
MSNVIDFRSKLQRRSSPGYLVVVEQNLERPSRVDRHPPKFAGRSDSKPGATPMQSAITGMRARKWSVRFGSFRVCPKATTILRTIRVDIW